MHLLRQFRLLPNQVLGPNRFPTVFLAKRNNEGQWQFHFINQKSDHIVRSHISQSTRISVARICSIGSINVDTLQNAHTLHAHKYSGATRMGRQSKRWKKKGGRAAGGRGGGGPGRGGGGPGRRDGETYVQTVVDAGNFKLEAYYAAQGVHDHRWNEQGELVPCNTVAEFTRERLAWRNAIASILPSSFRIAKDVSPELRQKMEADLDTLLAQTPTLEDGVSAIRKLQFLPHAFQLGFDRTKIRKHPELQALHEWLKAETDCGHITRQETVSMIPPVVLNTQPNDSVLDMCAAPGSKTSQILEQLDGPRGCLVANDANPQRAYMLTHQLRRIMHVNPVVMITACDAQFFPAVTQFDKILADAPCSGDGTSRKNIGVWKTWTQVGALGLHTLQVEIAWKGASQLLRVGGDLCYSTCSMNPMENEAVVAELLRRGQGQLELVPITLQGFRTRPGWSAWKVLSENKSRRDMKSQRNKRNAQKKWEREQQQTTESKLSQNLISTPVDSSVDGSDQTLLANGVGNVEKSNNSTIEEPIEPDMNSTASPKRENMDDNDNEEERDEVKADRDMVDQRFEPTGMNQVELLEMAKQAGLEEYHSMTDVPESLQRRVKESCFPPTIDEADTYHLDRCLRCYAHDNDTGGFFVALLRKKGTISAKDRRVQRASDSTVVVEAEPPVKKARVEDDDEDDTSPTENSNTKQEVLNDGNKEDGDNDDEDVGDPDERAKGNKISDKDQGKDDFVPVEGGVLDPIVEYYGLTGPEFCRDQFMTRAGGDAKVIYYIGAQVRALIDLGIQDRVTMINSGLKAFVRNNKECDCKYRVAQEGVHFIAPHMSARKFIASKDDFVNCLQTDPTSLAIFSDEFSSAIRPIAVGSFVVVLEGYDDQYHRKMCLSMWRCRGDNINALVAKVEIDGIQSKLQSMEAKKETECTNEAS